MNKEKAKWKEELYEEKNFIVPNGGDIKKVEITYEDWLWIEDFISKTIQAEREEIISKIANEIPIMLHEFANIPLDKRKTGWEWIKITGDRVIKLINKKDE